MSEITEHSHNTSNQPNLSMSAKPKSAGLAGVMSFVLPGLGQIYNGRFLWAIFWLIITPGFWITGAGFFSIFFHIISAFQAYRYAKRTGG